MYKKEKIELFGEKLGFLLSFMIFTTILFFILNLTSNHSNWNYIDVLIITVTIVGIGFGLKQILN
ncbi:hypothetical protein HN587_05660 [Candidatus Woesearchaeota archaeon]|jgi:hypothetical protein|nr:hypothetical protein [Candidatus Woesearchaeota archaeon]